jgi:hypothetical protein
VIKTIILMSEMGILVIKTGILMSKMVILVIKTVILVNEKDGSMSLEVPCRSLANAMLEKNICSKDEIFYRNLPEPTADKIWQNKVPEGQLIQQPLFCGPLLKLRIMRIPKINLSFGGYADANLLAKANHITDTTAYRLASRYCHLHYRPHRRR